MRGARWFAVAVAAALAAPAAAQDAPPAKAKHENRITPEAQAAMERFRKLVYRPADHGLTTMNGEVVATGFPSRPRTTFQFTAPRALTTSVPPGFDDEQRRLGLTGSLFDFPLSTALDPSSIFVNRECDADVVESAGRPVLRLNTFRDGKPTGSCKLEIDTDGLVTGYVWHAPADDSRLDYAVRYVWEKCSDVRRLSVMEVTFDGREAPHYACAYRYSEVAGLHVVSSYEMTYFTQGRAPKTFAFHVDRLVVNGSPAELPTPWKRKNRISPEAKTTIDRFEAIIDRPCDRSLSSMTGVIAPVGLELRASATRVVVSVKAGDRDRARAAAASGLQMTFSLAILGVPLSFSPEFDAELAEKDGVRVLVATELRDGVAACRTETTFDATGLPSAMRATGLAPGAPASEFRFTWSKSGARWRLAELEVWDVAMKVHVKTAFDYVEVAGMFVPASFRQTYTGGSFNGVTVEFVIEDLAVNGTKVETPPRANGSASDKK